MPRKTFDIIAKLSPAKATPVFETYWRFAQLRQEVFFKRLERQPYPWTEDEILLKYKFTNAYRSSDRVSQYLIKNVLYDKKRNRTDTFFRCILFKIFNKIETWELLSYELGDIRYSPEILGDCSKILDEALNLKISIYSGAYIMPSGTGWIKTKRKHHLHLKLIKKMMDEELYCKISEAKSMGKVFEMIRAYPTIGDFLAYQYVTDINYSDLTNFSEMEFVVPGPGARNGIRKCFYDLGGLTEIDVIKYLADNQEDFFDHFELNFRSLWGRKLQLIDCQNLFCEVDKYSRVKHPEFKGITNRTRIKQIFKANRSKLSVFYPPKWGINALINND